jgi:hypothetical protein
MIFSYPWAFLILIPFAVLFFRMKKLEKKRFFDVPASMIVRRPAGMKNFAGKNGRFLWLFPVFLLVCALSEPYGVMLSKEMSAEGRIMVFCADLSTSMFGTYRSATGRSSLDVMKEYAQVFVKKRASTDLVGITAYGGRSRGRKNGEAAIIVLPTSEERQLYASIKVMKPGMLGAYTSIGEGLLVSIFSCIDHKTLEKINITKLVKSIEEGDRTYALEAAKKIGHLKNRVIILFTDGKNNSGIEPEHAFYLAKILGIKVHFGSLESTGATGLTEAEEKREKEKIIKGVTETGGVYMEMNVAENLELFFGEIDRLETARLEFSFGEQKKSLRSYFIFAASFFIVLLFAFENIYPRIQP